MQVQVGTAAGERPFYDSASVKTTTWSACISGVVLITGIGLAGMLGPWGLLAVGGGAG